MKKASKSPLSALFFRAFFVCLLAFSSTLKAEVLVSDDFSTYPDGALTDNVGWTKFSGTEGQIQVVAGAVTLTDADSEDAGTAFAAQSSGEVFYAFDFSVADPGSYTGTDYEYFALFKDDAFDYGSRLDIAAFAVEGFKLGIAGGSSTAQSVWATNLDYDTSYRAVVRSDFATGISTLWISPSTINDVNIGSSADTVSQITTFGFRQAGATPNQTISVDNLVVSTTFAEAAGDPPSPTDPAISSTGSFSSFATFLGTASDSQSIDVGAVNLTEPISVVAPIGFEVSLDDATFASSLSITQTGGVSAATLYARVAATAPEGSVSGSLSLTSAGATELSLSLSASVRPSVVLLPYGPESFETTSEPWFTFSQAGSSDWQYVTSTRGDGQSSGAPENKLWQANGYQSTPSAVYWLMIGPVDLSTTTNPVISFNALKAFATVDDELEVIVSSDFNGVSDPTTATWSTGIPFPKPETENTKSASGQISLADANGQASVYVAFRYTATATPALWQVDDVEIYDATTPALSVTAPGSLDEGTSGFGTVFLPAGTTDFVTVTVTSADPAKLLVDNGYGDLPAASCEVPIFGDEGETSAAFNITTLRDYTVGADVQVQIAAESAGFDFGQAFVTVRNLDLPAVSLTSDGYAQDFATFVSEETLPLGWALQASSSSYGGDWGTGTSSGTRGNASVFGYQHTGSSGLVQQVLTLQNDTGSVLEALTIGYLGQVERPTQGRSPIYTVTVNGEAVSSLAYSTEASVNEQLTAAITGLSIPVGQTVEIVWSSERGGPGGGSKQIGISDFSVQIGAEVLPPSVGGLSIPADLVERFNAAANADVFSDNGSTLTGRGFVYAATATNPAPEIGGIGVEQVEDPAATTGAYTANLSSLLAGTSYSIAAYATNGEGTTYSTTQTFTTDSPAASFTGLGISWSLNNFDGTFPSGWNGLSSGGANAFGGDWGSGSSAGYRGNVSDPGVLGYQHTSSSGTLEVGVTLVNDTGSTIDTLYVAYLGRVSRTGEQNDPAWAVDLDGTIIEDLAYSTGNTAGPEGAPTDLEVTATITGLSIAAGEDFSMTWTSNRGSLGGTARQIGFANVRIQTTPIGGPAITVDGSLSAFSTTLGEASTAQTFATGGTGLNGDILVTAPAQYEVGVDGITFASSVTLPVVEGSVASTTVYTRIAATADAGNPAGQVSIASSGATTQNIAVTGTVSSGGYDSWASGFGLDPATDGAPAADPDGDGYLNDLEYAFGTNPTEGNGAVVEATSDGLTLLVAYLALDSGATYTVQSVADLATGDWASAGITPTASSNQTGVPVGYTRMEFSVSDPSGGNFYRVEAALP